MSDKWTKEDEELYQKKYEESLKELQPYDNGFFKRNLMKDVDKALASKAMKGMVNYAKDKDYNDKEQAVEDTLLAAGATSGAVKGAKDAKNAKTKAVPKAGKVADAVGEKMAAGAEGMSFTTPRESLDTRDLTAEQYKNLKNGLRDAARKLDVGDFALDPTVDVSEYNGKVISKPKKKKDGKPVTAKMSLEPDVKRNAITKAGYETTGDWKKAGNKQYRKMVDKPTEYEPTSKSKDTHALDESIRLGDDVYERNHGGEQKPEPNRQKEQDNIIRIADFMQQVQKNHPDLAEAIRANADDLHIRDPKQKSVINKYSDGIQRAIKNDKGFSGSERREDLLESRPAPIARSVLSKVNSDEGLINDAKIIRGERFVDRIIKNKALSYDEKKWALALGIGGAVASFMYSEDGDDKLTNKIVKANQEQLSGKNAPAWVKDKAKVWDNWLDTFDASKMENEDDYKAYLEATQLVDDYKKGQKIMSNTGNTNAMAELLTVPKYVNLLMKYNPDDAKKVFGLGKK